MKQLVKIYTDAPPLGKIILIALVCVILFVAYRLLKKVLTPGPANENLLDSSKSELTQLQQAGEIPSYSESQFNGWADSLYQAMDGQGTDEDAIKGVFRYMQNKADVLKLIKAFGLKDYTDDKFLMWNIKPMNLNEWLTAELSTAEKDEFINSQLKIKSINYTF